MVDGEDEQAARWQDANTVGQLSPPVRYRAEDHTGDNRIERLAQIRKQGQIRFDVFDAERMFRFLD
jgi:hypothetical protein